MGRRAREAFEAMEAGRCTIYVPMAVSLELWFLARAGRLDLGPGLASWWASVETEQLVMVDNTHDDVLGAYQLNWDHQDVFDRIIVQTALRVGAPLITSDAAITDWGGVEVIW